MENGKGQEYKEKEELARAEHELCEVEVQLHNLSDRRKLLLERIGKLKDSILLKQNHVLTSRDWSSTDFPWSGKVTEVLNSVFKLDGFRPLQHETINAVLSNEDVILIMPTGGGKSLCYQLPALVKSGNVQAMLNKNAKLKLLYVTPEKLAKSKRFMTKVQKMYGLGRLSLIAIDEVHCCSQWGHDFRPDYKFLGVLKGMFPDVPVLGLTATATSKITIDVQKMLRIQGCLVLKASFNRPNLYYEVRTKASSQEECLKELEELLKTRYCDQSGIIYTTSIKDCEQLMHELRKRKLRVGCYHANLEAKFRSEVHAKWLSGEHQAVVATIAFGLGIDKPDVRFVVHHSLSKSMENFYQESGRAGRDGLRAECILMYRLSDVFKLSSMVFTQQTGRQNLYNIVEYCLDAYRCRRAIIASHFDEVWKSQDCNAMCDHCCNLKERKEMIITPFCQAFYQLISNAAANDIKLTAQKLLDAWYGKGAVNLRVRSVPVPSFSRERGEAVLGHLLIKGYLQEDFHFTPYSTISYLKRGPKAAAAMSDKHNITMHISGKSVPTLSEQSHNTAGNTKVTLSSKCFIQSPKIETYKKVKKSDGLEMMCVSKAEVLNLTLDTDDKIQVHGARKRNSQKRKVIVLDSDSDN
ncbi:ATP-dependent DNA helicase Q1-like isoform X2 [Zootermopsis nevadensis]|uniref:ATP-dependent DNA helicase Q1-like isoform X2 n=1 Tax=Zootermopsis nevadensis TaxID=136037 RepID=UPI000B8E5CB4|nr:ATP-dependent DNA helicase Q1-like isoform X2 [Zootermopsis nevadensis]